MRFINGSGAGARTAGICATLILLAGCVTAGSVSAPPDASTELSAPPESTSPSTAPTSDPTGNCGSANISVDYVPYSVTSLANSGWTFAEAVVTSFEPAVFNTVDGTTPSGFMVKPAPGEPHSDGKIFTPVDVQVDLVISGRTKPSVDRFLIEGGTVGCYTTRVDVSPVVQKGARYVFVLADALDATGKSILDSQEAKFAWPVDDSGTVATPDGPESIDSLSGIVAKASPVPQASAVPNQ